MKYHNLIFGLSLFTAIGTLMYWILVFTGLFPLTEVVPGYLTWFYSFPLADFWIIVTSALLAFAVKTNRDAMAAVCGLLSASSMIFLALNGLLFGINTGMICMVTTDEIIEIAIKLYCLSVGGFYIRRFSSELGKSFVLRCS
jgi:hypothetical protein